MLYNDTKELSLVTATISEFESVLNIKRVSDYFKVILDLQRYAFLYILVACVDSRFRNYILILTP